MPARNYGDKLSRDTEAANRRSRSARDIAGDYPPPGDLARRDDCRFNLRRFFEVYFPKAFPLRWSPDHLRVIDRLEECILHGGLFGLAMTRGSGKTTMMERAALFAILYGWRRYVCIVGATQAHASDILASMKTELLENDLLAQDFRSVCHAVRRLEGNARKASGQLCNGKPTRIVWGQNKLVLPAVPEELDDGLAVGGSIITARPLMGSLRGQKHTLPTGKVVRPDLVLLDDPQTRESAASVDQTAQREKVVRGDVLGMAGPGRQIACVMTCTVIRQGDLSERILDRKANPAWRGERTRFVLSWATNRTLWEEYHRLRGEAQRAGRDTSQATEFYRANRQAMDAGAAVSWPERFDEGELSAIQHAENKRSDIGPAAFAAEYQNDPEPEEGPETILLTAAQVCQKLNGLRRGVVPLGASYLTSFVDVHDSLLFWSLCAWAPGFTGALVDYGTFPRQSGLFTLRKASPTLQDVFPGMGREAAIRAGLEALTAELLGREWCREDGTGLRVGRGLIDSGYEPDLVRAFCRRSTFAAVLMPSRGVGVGATMNPMRDWERKQGEQHCQGGAPHWIIAPTTDRAGLNVRFDAHSWKTFVFGRLAVAEGDAGGLSLFGDQAEGHRLYAEHVTAEAPVMVSAQGRTVGEWRMRPGLSENHWLDTLVGCAVGASMLGVRLDESQTRTGQPRESRREVQKRKMEERRRGRDAL
jgi:hypothetical protein